MNEAYARLHAVMSDILTIQEALLALSERTKKAVSDGDIQNLDKIVREEQVLLARMSEIEKKRALQAYELGKALGIPAGEVTLARLTESAPEPFQKPLQMLAENFRQTLNALRKNNDINSKLLFGRLETVSLMIDSSAAQQESNFYSARGADARKRDQKTNLYDRKI